MILVLPFYGQIGQLNSFPPDRSYETVILDELLPAVERDFCTWNDRDHRAIGGISRGGFWAFSLTLRHPDVFSIVGGHSAFFPNNPNEVPPQFSPLELALNSAFLSEINLRIIWTTVRATVVTSQQLFQPPDLTRYSPPVINPVGEHDNDCWSAHVPEYLAFYGKTAAKLGRAAAAQTSP
jgi:enterochelin esterase-like enzyme